MKNSKILIKTKSKKYPIYFGNKILGTAGNIIKNNIPNVKKVCIITDTNLPKASLRNLTSSLKKYNVKIYKLRVSEKIKNIKIANKIIEDLLKNNFNRSDCVISFGGGVVGDLTAFISSVTKRGLKFINIPTTLLAQVDAAIGGKTGINTKDGKNLIGTFYQPEFVLSDLAMINSLSRREMICGYGEILKHSLIKDKNFFNWLSKNNNKIIIKKNKKLLKTAIAKSCLIKSQIINKDEKEINLRMILNFGHTFAHGFEGAKNFSNKLNHGEAVLLGMIAASKLSNKKKLLPSKDLNLIIKHYKNANLPLNFKKFFKKNEINKIINFMKKDKKNLNNKINLILLKKIGQVTSPIISAIKESELRRFMLSILV